jgi:hypothetical protein
VCRDGRFSSIQAMFPDHRVEHFGMSDGCPCGPLPGPALVTSGMAWVNSLAIARAGRARWRSPYLCHRPRACADRPGAVAVRSVRG